MAQLAPNMTRYGIKNLTLDTIFGLKREVLFFDQIVFDLDAYLRMRQLLYAWVAAFRGSEEADRALREMEETAFKLEDAKIIRPYSAGRAMRQHAFEFEQKENGRFELEIEVPVRSDWQKENVDRLCNLLREYYADRETDEREREVPLVVTSLEAFAGVVRAAQTRATRDLKLLALLTQYVDAHNVYEPLLPTADLVTPTQMLRTRDVSRIVIDQFPVPVQNASWDAILTFRLDESNRVRILALRNWMNKIARGDATLAEIREELEYLIADHEAALKLHRIKYERTTLEFAVVTALEVIEDVLKLKWSTAARRLFEISKARADFIVGERDLVGKEVAYLTAVRERFDAPPSG